MRGQYEDATVVCNDCHFERVVSDDDRLPAEVVIEHGKSTGHTLSIEYPEE